MVSDAHSSGLAVHPAVIFRPRGRLHARTHDRRETAAEKSLFAAIRNAERSYSSKLRQVARMIDVLVRGMFHPNEEPDPNKISILTRQLDRYSEILRPWAEATANRMLMDVMRRDERAWRALGRALSRGLFDQLQSADIGVAYRAALDRQVTLITSLPPEAAQRVQQLATQSIHTGARPGEIRYPGKPPPGLARDILETGLVTVGRANLIARTEVGRASFEFTAARAQHIGSSHYIWQSANDRDVRPAHRKLDGRTFAWSDPPVATEPGQKIMRYHPGAGPNCRCFAEPIVPPPE